MRIKILAIASTFGIQKDIHIEDQAEEPDCDSQQGEADGTQQDRDQDPGQATTKSNARRSKRNVSAEEAEMALDDFLAQVPEEDGVDLDLEIRALREKMMPNSAAFAELGVDATLAAHSKLRRRFFALLSRLSAHDDATGLRRCDENFVEFLWLGFDFCSNTPYSAPDDWTALRALSAQDVSLVRALSNGYALY